MYTAVGEGKTVFLEMQWHEWISKLWDLLVMLGKPVLIGLPMLAAILAVIGCVVVRVA